MPTAPPSSHDVALETRFFLERFKKEIIAVLIVALLAVIAFTGYRYYSDRRAAAASASLANAKTAQEYQQVIDRYQNSPRSSDSPESNPMPETEEFVATGRRKTSVARIRMMPGSGKIDINGRSFEDYFPTVPLQNVVLQPLQTAKAVNTYDLSINTTGGGIMGQAGAAQLAIARALLQVDGNLRGTLKAEGLLRRDPRMKERKKSGQPGARKRFQFSKR
jgi:small subunit ribosomal protein S9